MEDSVAESESLMPHLKINSQDKFEEDKAKEIVNGGKEEEKPSGGLLTSLISNLVSPSSTPKARDAYEEKREDEGEFKRKREDETANGGVQSKGGGGVFNSLISNFLHGQNGGGEDQDKKVEGNGVVEENKKAKVEEEGAGILDNIGEAVPVPPPDEASILIHSIIHD